MITIPALKNVAAKRIMRISPRTAYLLRPPGSVSIELTSICNIHCVCCPIGQGKIERGIMTEENFRKILDLLPDSIKQIDFTHRGDPSCHPEFPNFVRMAHETGRKTQAFTNGLILDRHIDGLVESGLTKLLIDVDGSTPDSYLNYRVGSNFEKVIKNIRLLAETRKKSSSRFPEQIFTLCVVTSANEHQVSDLQNLARELGVDGALFKTAILNYGTKYYKDKEEQDALSPKNPEFVRPQPPDNLVCPFLWRGSILHNGDFLICTCDFEGFLNMGNILKENSYEKVFYSEKARSLRKQVLDHSSPICRTCSVVGQNHYIRSATKVFAEI